MNGEGAMPPLVVAEGRWIRRNAPYPVDVEANLLPNGTWQLTLVSDRVQLEARYGPKGKPLGAVVVIDGEAMPYHYSEVELLDVLRHPGEFARGELVPMPEHDGSRVPAIIQHSVGLIHAKLAGHEGITVSAAFNGIQWVVGIDMENGDGMRMFIRRHGKHYAQSQFRPFQVRARGEDLTEQAGDSIESALLALLGCQDPEPASARPRVHGQPAQAVNSVQVRKSTVIRVLPAIDTIKL